MFSRSHSTVDLADTSVPYVLHRVARRTLGFQVGPDGLVVRAPARMPLHAIEAALHSKSRWIVCKLGEMAEREQRRRAACLQWADGVVIPYLGQTLRISLDASAPQGATVLDGDGTRLILGLPLTAAGKEIQTLTQSWLMQQAQDLFRERLNQFAPLLQVSWRQLTLSQAKTRWGSARSDGAIRLSWRLMQFSLDVIDYVVVHELSHLRVMNHSPRFWATVAAVMPDYQVRKQLLKNDVMGF